MLRSSRLASLILFLNYVSGWIGALNHESAKGEDNSRREEMTCRAVLLLCCVVVLMVFS